MLKFNSLYTPFVFYLMISLATASSLLVSFRPSYAMDMDMDPDKKEKRMCPQSIYFKRQNFSSENLFQQIKDEWKLQNPPLTPKQELQLNEAWNTAIKNSTPETFPSVFFYRLEYVVHSSQLISLTKAVFQKFVSELGG